MRGYFAIGIERLSKAGNAGNLMRSAHAFGASFFFLVDPATGLREMRKTDTSAAADHLPLYLYDNAAVMDLPQGCHLVGVELIDAAIPLPSFRHPTRAAYVLGPERGSLTPEMQARCAFIVQIPMKFCINVGVAGAIIMYDRMLSMGRFAERPVGAGAPTEDRPAHVQGAPVLRTAGHETRG